MSLLLPLFPLFGFSLLILGGLSWQLAVNQALFIVLGLFLFWFISRYPLGQHRFLSRYYAAAVVIILLLPFLFGAVTRGAIRWIPLGGFSLQPSELAKPLLILVFADYLARGRPFLGYLGLLLVPFALIFKQPDLGTSLVIGAVWLGMFWFSRAKAGHRLGLLLALLLVLPLGLRLLQPYQRQRLTNFLNPYSDPAGSGYQVIQALIAVGSGGLFGQGLGRGSQSQLQFLPERQTDFIFSALSEELGVIAAAGLLISYWFLLKKLLLIAQGAQDQFGRLVALGVTTMIWFQVMVTVGMNLGLMPVTGITLPLVSAGGSSLLAIMACLGLAASL